MERRSFLAGLALLGVDLTALAPATYAHLSATGAPVSAGQLAAAAGLSASHARALVAEFHARPASSPRQQWATSRREDSPRGE